jgi:transketolase
MEHNIPHRDLANAIRALSMDAVAKAKSGHAGLPLGTADIATVLFRDVLKFDPDCPDWFDRDRFVLSAGHGSMLLYSLLYLTGTKGLTIGDIENFRQLGSKTPGHPEYGHTPGVDTTTGPLGQGIATAVGMAIAERMLHAQFGNLCNHYTYVLCGDGDLMEGVSQEAIAIAGHLGLNKLIVIFDNNNVTIDGPLEIADSVDQVARFKSARWNARAIDGHDPKAILAALREAQTSDKPTMIAAKTIIGFGQPNHAGTNKAHGEISEVEATGARAALGWDHPPFVVPDPILSEWREAGAMGRRARKEWNETLASLPDALRQEFSRRIMPELPEALGLVVQEKKRTLAADSTEMATRKAGENALKALAPVLPELVTGSADLTGSNNTKVAATPAISARDFSGRYIHWGIREHGMAAACNGIALHGGMIPSGATFMAFADYARPAIRLAALMGAHVIHVMTHDSIGLGEDGPTHQPVEHLASLRAIPNLLVFRPSDQTETLEAWEAALRHRAGPSILALTRQNLPQARKSFSEQNLVEKGAYELSPASSAAAVSIFATGSEVSIALEAQRLLELQGVTTRVVSVPCMELFGRQPDRYISEVIGMAPIRVGVEAAIRQGWDWIIGDDGLFIGMTGFGASAPAKALFEHFGITAHAVVEAIQQRRAKS